MLIIFIVILIILYFWFYSTPKPFKFNLIQPPAFSAADVPAHHPAAPHEADAASSQRCCQHRPHAAPQRNTSGHDRHEFSRAMHLRESEPHGAHAEQTNHELEELKGARPVELKNHRHKCNGSVLVGAILYQV